ncbi:hypothetical protein [Halarchaeum sp. P4]|uniref:hypothetical protein n=1 Tax=Halarchaeum sp. P4 TaxID=3421639 RepID=UPI003EBD9817
MSAALDKVKLAKVGTVLLSLATGGAHLLARFGVVAVRVGARLGGAGVIGALTLLTDEERRREAFHWLLLSGNRWYIVAAMEGSFVLMALSLGLADIIGVRESGFVTTMFSTINSGLFSFVPIVVSINSLTITRLFGTPEGLRERIEEVQEFREGVEDLSSATVSPTDPAGFLALVIDSLHERVDTLEAAVEDDPDRTKGDVHALVGDVRAAVGDLDRELAEGDASVFSVLLPMVNENYSRDINHARRVKRSHREALSEEAEEALEDVQELLVSLDVTRQYFKVLYLQQELAAVSRYIAYSGIGAFVLSTLVIMIYSSGYPPIVNAEPLLALVSVSLGVAFLPFSVLFAHVVRVATVIKRTSAPGAFTPPGERPGRFP